MMLVCITVQELEQVSSKNFESKPKKDLDVSKDQSERKRWENTS